MTKINFSDTDLNTLKELIDYFKEVDGDDDKPLELEDFYSLVSMGRSINSILEEAITYSK